MEQITDAERACLKQIAAHPGTLHPECGNDVVAELVIKGLVEKRPALGLPVMPPASSYQLTTRGRILIGGGD